MNFFKNFHFYITWIFFIRKSLAFYHSSQFSIDTNPYKSSENQYYDLLLTLKIEKKQISNQIFCIAADSKHETKFIEKENFLNGKITENFEFAGLNYIFVKFERLLNYEIYEMYCFENTSSNNLKGPKNFFNTFFQFPKEKFQTNILAFGDWGKSGFGQESLNLMTKYINFTDSIAFLGDLAYDLNDENGQRGNNFLKFINNITLSLPFQLSPGNHESINEYEHYFKRFYLPNRSEKKKFYFSYDVNDVHLISLNSEVEFDIFFDFEYKKNLISWLIDDLKNSDKKWKIAYMHRPVYCSMPGNDCIEDSEKMRVLFEKIFTKYKVDLVITGHRHNYERLLPINNYQIDTHSLFDDNNTIINPKYPIYAVCGATGNDEGMETNYYSPRNYSKIVGNTVGICTLKIDKDQLNFKHILTNYTIYDEFNLIKNNTEDKILKIINILVNPEKTYIDELDILSYFIDIIIISLFLTFLVLTVKTLYNYIKTNNIKKIFDEENMKIMNLIVT